MPVSEMFPLLITGNFLEIKGLLRLMVKAVALEIQGRSVEEIRKTFDIEDPKWSPEELQKLKEENAWAYETKKQVLSIFDELFVHYQFENKKNSE